MINRGAFTRRVLHYALLENPDALAAVRARIAAIKDAMKGREAGVALDLLRRRILRMDLQDFGWPPQCSEAGNEDILFADVQRLVSAVIRFDHNLRQAQVLKYVLKERP